MTTWSEAQHKAIYTKNKNILVSASAGSGKTTVLIARLLNLIQNEKVEINRILAMTFTEAAASEMKKRLSIALNDALAKCEIATERTYLQTQLANISSSYISTIHGFCLNIIQNYYYVISLKKERISNIMDEAVSSAVLDYTMRKTFQHFIEKEEFIDLCTFFSSKPNSDEALKQAILSLFNLANAKSNPHSFLESCRPIENVQSFKDYPKHVISLFFEYLLIQTATILNSCEEYAFFLQEEEKKLKTVQDKIEKGKKCIEYISNEEYDLFRKQFLIYSAISLPTIKDHDEAKLLRKQITDIEDSLHAILFEEAQFVSYTNENCPYIHTLLDVTTYFLNTYNAYKDENDCMDFSDMEHFALQILKAQQGLVASLYREQFYEIMVDEFQDSNDVQDELVHLICKDNNVFRVGDIKQSIYGFRHATPDIMRSLIENQKENDEVIYLSSNYRSKQSVVDFNNALFDVLMNVKGFRSHFSEYDRTLCGISAQSEDCVPVQFHILDEATFKNYRTEIIKSKDDLKADYIAHQIAQKVQEGYSYRDFVILIKTNAKAEPLRDAFERYNIPYFISMKQGFYDSSAVSNVITFLKALYKPNEDIHFIAFLRSPFMQLDNDALVEARLHKRGSYYQYFKENASMTFFQELLLQKNRLKVSSLLNQIYAFNQYYECYTNEQEKSNLDKLFEIACQYEQKQFLTLEQFLDVIEQSSSAKIGEAIPIGNEDNVVRVMSIHQSKGLQFPVVYLYSIRNVSIMDTKGVLSLDDELKIGLDHIDLTYRYTCPTIERIALNHKITRAVLEEEMRLLYVATTRAQKEMHIVDISSKGYKNPINSVEIYKKKGFTSWILQTLYHIQDTVSYYREISVNEMWDTLPLEKEKKRLITKLEYGYDYKESTTFSPSENEILSYRPRPFSFYEDYAMERGTSLHKMVEVLPNTTWTKENLEDVAKQYEITLQEHDIDILLALCTHPLFKEAQTQEVIHEFPFMIKEEENITHGYMDYVSKSEDKVIMIDFKSDRNVDVATLIERYKGQIDAYTHALYVLYPTHTIESYIYSFELKEMIPM